MYLFLGDDKIPGEEILGIQMVHLSITLSNILFAYIRQIFHSVSCHSISIVQMPVKPNLLKSPRSSPAMERMTNFNQGKRSREEQKTFGATAWFFVDTQALSARYIKDRTLIEDVLGLYNHHCTSEVQIHNHLWKTNFENKEKNGIERQVCNYHRRESKTLIHLASVRSPNLR